MGSTISSIGAVKSSAIGGGVGVVKAIVTKGIQAIVTKVIQATVTKGIQAIVGIESIRVGKSRAIDEGIGISIRLSLSLSLPLSTVSTPGATPGATITTPVSTTGTSITTPVSSTGTSIATAGIGLRLSQDGSKSESYDELKGKELIVIFSDISL